MDFIKEILLSYSKEIIEIIVLALFAWLGFIVKKLANKTLADADSKIVKSVVKTCVQAVEQLYKDLHGEDKLNKALETISNILIEKNISVTEEELKVLIEAAVGEFNEVFNKTE